MRKRCTAARFGLGLPVAIALVLSAWQAPSQAQPGGDPGAQTPPPPTPAAGQPAADGDAPVNIRLRRIEQKVQALKERAWRGKARVGMLKEAVLGVGLGARAGILHLNKMGKSFRLVQLVYALDGTQIFTRNETEESDLYKQKSFEILSGPMAPGSHTISVLATYRGHGYGVFKYLKKYKFTVRASHTFTAAEGKATTIKVVGFEKGGVTMPLEKRPAIDFKVDAVKGSEKAK